MTRILIVDDDAEFRASLLEVLKEEGYDAETSGSAKEALSHDSSADYDVILLDFMMPGLNGIDALAETRKRHPKAKIIMITAFATVDNAVSAVRRGAAEYISKPFKINDLLTTIRRVLEQAKFEKFDERVDLDRILNSISSQIRRNILALLATGPMRLMEITRELSFDDHTKVVFHLKMLREAGIVEQKEEKLYWLTLQGLKICECLKNMENTLIYSPADR